MSDRRYRSIRIGFCQVTDSTRAECHTFLLFEFILLHRASILRPCAFLSSFYKPVHSRFVEVAQLMILFVGPPPSEFGLALIYLFILFIFSSTLNFQLS